MTKFLSKIAVLTIFSVALPISATGAISPRVKPKPLCRLEVQNAHISRTVQKKEGRDVVKVNVLSICNVRQSKVLITLEIHKKGELGDRT